MADKKQPLTSARMAELVRRLGDEKDIDLAAEFDITRQRVSDLRKQRKISVFKPEEKPLGYPIPVCFTKADIRAIKKAMKAMGYTNRSGYIRDAVRRRNKDLEEKP